MRKAPQSVLGHVVVIIFCLSVVPLFIATMWFSWKSLLGWAWPGGPEWFRHPTLIGFAAAWLGLNAVLLTAAALLRKSR